MRLATMIIALFLVLIVGFQSCAAAVGGGLMEEEATTRAGAVGLFVAFLFLIGGAFAIGAPLVSVVCFVLASTFGFAAGFGSDFRDLRVWAFVALILATMSFFGHRERQTRREEERRGA